MKVLIAVFIVALLTMFSGIFRMKKYLVAGVLLALTGILAMCIKSCNCHDMFWYQYILDEDVFRNMFFFSSSSQNFSSLLIFTTILIVLTSRYGLIYAQHKRDDLLALMLFSLCGGIILTGYTHLVMLFLGIEILSIPMYVLAGSDKSSERSSEAALKYYIMGAFASAIMLFGIALIYGATRGFTIYDLQSYIAQYHNDMSPMFIVGMLMLLVGFAFKTGAVPFHFWSPDVYTGAPTFVTTFMATVVKTSAFAALFILFGKVFAPLGAKWHTAATFIAAATMVLGNFIATTQQGLKRMLAYSGLAHAGYLFMLLPTASLTAESSLFLYLSAYSVSSVVAFSILNIIEREKKSDSFESLRGLGKNNMLLALTLSVALLSMAGIPPLAGFMAKYYLFVNVWQSHAWLVIVAVVTSAVSVSYYLKPIIAVWFYKPDLEVAEINLPRSYIFLFVIGLGSIIAVGLNPDVLLKLF